MDTIENNLRKLAELSGDYDFYNTVLAYIQKGEFAKAEELMILGDSVYAQIKKEKEE